MGFDTIEINLVYSLFYYTTIKKTLYFIASMKKHEKGLLKRRKIPFLYSLPEL